MSRRFVHAILAATAFEFMLAQPAEAEFKVCNQTLNLYNIAIGTEKSGDFQTEGWWTLPANACVSPIKETLASRYVYVFATSIYGDDALTGETSMCISSDRQFVIQGRTNCWVRGFQEARFKEVDTRAADVWTVFIRENQN